MAERYAAQRSSKPLRRRTLPRLSDATGPGTAVVERGPEDDPYINDDEGADIAPSTTTATFTAGATPRPQSTLPRRATPTGRRGGGVALASTPRVDYSYVKRDLRRIAITAVTMLVLLIVLNVILQSFIHSIVH